MERKTRARKKEGSVVFEVVRDVVPGERLVAFLLPDMSSDDTFLLPALTFLRSSLYRQTIDSIMAEAPLDLSRSLLTSPSSPSSLESVRVPSGHLKRKPDHSPVRSPSPVPSSPTPIPSPKNNIPQFPTVPSSFFPLRHPPVGMGLRDLDLNLSRMPSLPLNLTPPTSSGNSSTGSLGVRTPKTSDLPVSTHSETPLSLGPPKRRERTMLPCSECGKAFDRPSLLKRHMRTHTGEKPHVCDVCGKGFSTSSSLNTHRRIHSGEKPHQCGVCGKRFTASSNLYYHKMTHVKEKPHKCSLCTRSFPTPGDLRSHMFVHNGQWPHKCTICGKGFSKLTNLRNHALLHAEMKRTERQLTSLPSSLTSPAASTSGSDTPLTPPAAYTPPTYSTFNRSTSQNSPTSGIPPSPSTSHLSQSPPSSPSESIILSSSSSPSTPAPAEEKDRLQPLATSHSNADQEVDRCLPDSTNDDVKKLTTAEKLASDIHEEKHYIENEKKTETEGESKSSAETCSLPVTSQPLTTNTSAVSSSAVPSSHRESAPPKLSFSLDALLGSSKKEEDDKVQNDRDSCTSKEDSRVIQHTKLMDNQIQAERSENPKADEQTTER